MANTLSNLAPKYGATRKRKRVGRGPGSGTGKTAGRGQKGQKSRSGHHGAKVGFEGGQMPMQMRLPKRGFTNLFRKEFFPVNVATLEEKFGAGDVVNLEALRSLGIVPKKAKLVKILANGEITKALTVQVHKFSSAAKTKIDSAGGTCETLDNKAAPMQIK